MNIIFCLLLLSSCTSSVLSADVNDGLVLLKIKEQLGNPQELSNWVEGFQFCGGSAFSTNNFVIQCTSTGHVKKLIIEDIMAPSAPFPEAICDLAELEELNLVLLYNLYGPIPSCISQLSNLNFFSIYSTGLSGSLPESLFLNHQKFTDLILSSNAFSGSIPASLSTIPNLHYLDLSNNSLTGTIPPELVHGQDLVHGQLVSLKLSDNRLTGEIPKCYQWLPLSTIDIHNNQLTGDPSFLLSKENIYIIDLSHNDFEFDLSNVEISKTLRGLNLGFNEVYGKVPQSIASAHFYNNLDLRNNKLCGEIPQREAYPWQPFEVSIFANNKCLCGSPLPPCYNPGPASPSPPAD
ncbi:Polygalacturonase inhibitor protein [Rhynchospora pubera]|uniref:Polygalacturonase inhibitor protein n=1 Tax=Rhynchospora pubera TaxID=906938 RepID=A0AAV8DYT7_9POAL|nr:Polygalacturonase inhibitor protein [Rhynchospora pubera]